ncbi:hypothetical protein F4824DRAFT_358400 [Ustulina deusta]|nr:hypothetical protein F4823DRAFT_231775 [Ustulina deusta]KAI3340932.1 hypothetical protein F4824DRAFT_358400 [Ustulina deusta]
MYYRWGQVLYRPPRPPRPSPQAPRRRSPWTTPKRMIWTGAFAAVTIVGTIYGAGLKTQQEYQEEKKQILETSVEERIGALEARRAQLMGQKRPLEKKRDELRLRLQKKQNESREATETRS